MMKRENWRNLCFNSLRIVNSSYVQEGQMFSFECISKGTVTLFQLSPTTLKLSDNLSWKEMYAFLDGYKLAYRLNQVNYQN